MSRCNFPSFSFSISFPSLPSLNFPPPLPVFSLAFSLPCPLD